MTEYTAEKLNFPALAAADSEFGKIYEATKSKGGLDFTDKATQLAVSKATLRVHYGLKLELPDDRLCPPIPNRNIYVKWIQNLMDSTSPDYSGKYNPERKLVGLDIGTGASAIYTLLLLKQRPNWTMCATDVDMKSFDSALTNLKLNGFMDRAKPFLNTETNDIIPFKHLGIAHIDFTICNPPFFVDSDEMQRSLTGEGKATPAKSRTNAAPNEMICTGGDLGFVTRMLDESALLKENVTWYTSMFGKLKSARTIIRLLQERNIDNFAVGCIEPGDFTKRWIVGWSFGDYRPHVEVARTGTIENEFLPFPTQYRIRLKEGMAVKEVSETINGQLRDLDLEWTWDEQGRSGVGVTALNVWRRAYRRGQAKRTAAGEAEQRKAAEQGVALAFRVSVVNGEVVLDWLRGRDKVLWESFCGLIHRQFKQK
jgi:23S rRNA (adenine1618-N6)-methyltransferase